MLLVHYLLQKTRFALGKACHGASMERRAALPTQQDVSRYKWSRGDATVATQCYDTSNSL